MSFARFLERWADQRPDAIALHCRGVDVSYSTLWARIDAVTPALAREFGVRPGDRVAYLGYNDPELIVLLFALARLGAMLVPLNFRLAGPELAEIAAHAEVSVLLADRDFAAPVAAIRTGLPSLRVAGFANGPSNRPLDRDETGWADWAALTPRGASPVAEMGTDACPMMIVYTSGTTGKPKGAVHTQEGMLWNIVCATHGQDFTADDHVLMSLPMFHVGGLCIQTLPALHAGARVTMHPRFDPGAWLRDVAALRPNVSLLVPATVRAVIEHPDWPAARLGSLRLLNMGSSVVPQHFIQAFLDRQVPVGQVYGATETGPVSIVLRTEDSTRSVGSTGKPALHCDVRLVDQAGEDVPRGSVGEIWLRGKNMMAGYWKDAENPAFREGWFHSGDLARVDERGFYWVVGRSKEMIISGGENIYPAEIENILAASPAILDCAVVGRADAKWGEVAVAIVVRAPSSLLEAGDVLALLEGRIARYKHPREIRFVASLPKTALGKVQKADLMKLID